MAAISSSLTLLTNVVMTWNATRIGEVRAQKPEIFPDHHLIHIAPNAHEHVNTKGVITINGLVTVLCRSPISLCHLGLECERADAAQI